jgi:tetratricopeptide (TPR) repeat protein
MMRTIRPCYLFLILTLYSTTPLAAGIVTPGEETRYRQCVQQLRTDPANALRQAEDWVTRSGSLAAYHCQAMAEFRNKQYNASASTLNKLHSLLPTQRARLRRNIRIQSIKASRLGKNYRRATEQASGFIRSLQQGELAPADKRDLVAGLLERSKLWEALQQPLKAMQDLDHILSLNPGHQRARLRRARLYMELGDKHLSKQDLEYVLRQQPDNHRAQHLMKQLVEG